MLRSLEIVCPFCSAETTIGVSSGDGKEVHGASSSCRTCRRAIATVTLPDGQVALFEDGQLFALNVVSREKDEPRPSRSGSHRVLPPQNLGLFNRGGEVGPPAGISDAELKSALVLDTDQILWRPDGTRRPSRDAAKFAGWRSVWVAELNHHLRTRLSRPPPFSEPPAVFISYRWGTDEQNRWVGQLARTLTDRGYRALLDRLVPPDQVDVPAFVSGIVDSRYMLAIIDPGYVERLGTPDDTRIQDGWVFDEVQSAFRIENKGLIRIVGLLREGSALPSGFDFPAPGRPGKTIDVREPGMFEEFLDDVFPRRDPTASLNLAEAAYRASLDAFERGEHQAAFDRAREVVAHAPDIVDGYAQQVRICLALSAPDAGLAAASAALDRFPDFYELHLAAATFAHMSGDPAATVRHATRTLEFPAVHPPERAQAHALLGTSLDDFDQVEAAIAHLALAMRIGGRLPSLLQTLGYVRRRSGEPEAAARIFTEALQADPAAAPLHQNLVGALIEAGKPAEARAALAELAQAHPDPEVVARLGEIIARIEASGHRMSLVKQVALPAGDLRVGCSSCEAGLTASQGESLCAGCGCPRPSQASPCRFCDADGLVPLWPGGMAAAICPFCRVGTILVAAASPSGEAVGPRSTN